MTDEIQADISDSENSQVNNISSWMRMIVFSSIGLWAFFVPFTFNGKHTIALDHVVSFFSKNYPQAAAAYTLCIIIAGGLYPFISRTWNENLLTRILSFLKLTGIAFGLMTFFEWGPSLLLKADYLPFLYSKVVLAVAIIIPVGAIFLALLVDYGLLEIVGVFLRPIMRTVWKTPGRSAIDAAASFAGSYSIGLLITNKMYKEGRYSAKESAIIATGFSSVSAAFMVVVAKTLGLIEVWAVFFWSTLVITFIVTAITVRLPPISRMKNDYYNDEPHEELTKTTDNNSNIFRQALNTGLSSAAKADGLKKNIFTNVKDGFVMTFALCPLILSIGIIALVLAKSTPIFQFLGYFLYPITAIAMLPEPLLAAQALVTSLPDMFIPAILSAELPFITKYVVGVVSISSIIFMDGSVPCILATDIPIRFKDLIIVWLIRVVLSILIASVFAHILF